MGAPQCLPLARRPLREELDEPAAQLGDCGRIVHQAVVVDQAFVDPRLASGRAHEPLGVAEPRRDQRDVAAVGAAVPPEAEVTEDERPGGSLHPHAGGARVEQCVEERHLDVLPEAVALARDEGADDGQRAFRRGEDRRERKRRKHRLGALGHDIGTGGRHDDAFPPGYVSAWVVGSEARERDVDQARVPGEAVRWADPESVGDARTEVLDHDVRRSDERLRPGAVPLVVEIEGQVAPSAQQDRVDRRIPSGSARRVDPHDVGSLVGEQHPEERTGEVLAEVHHPHAGQRPRAVVTPDARLGRDRFAAVAHAGSFPPA